MKVKIFVLQYGRDMPEELFMKHAETAGFEYDTCTLKVSPLAKALNTGLAEFQKGYDYIGFLANDIEEPEGWLIKRVNYLQDKPKCGIVSIYPGEHIPAPGGDLIGNFLIKKEVFDKIGYFTEAFNNYGPIDLDYCTRARVSGFDTDYIPNERAIHYDSNYDTVYGFSKKVAVEESWGIHCKNVADLHSGNLNPGIIYPEYTINMIQFYGEE